MKRYKIHLFLTLTIILLCNIGSAQKSTDFLSLVTKTNELLAEYSDLNPFCQSHYSLKEFGLKKDDFQFLDTSLIYNDSIENTALIEYYQNKILSSLDQILVHDDFKKFDIQQLLKNITVVRSKDNKLYNFSFDAKSDGVYKYNISKMFYTDFIDQDNDSIDRYEIFDEEGYDAIDTIQTQTGTKYVLTKYFQEYSSINHYYLLLVSFENNKCVKEFYYTILSRSIDNKFEYDHSQKTISIEYMTDDLTSSCYCCNLLENIVSEDRFSLSDSDIEPAQVICKCKFLFDGERFITRNANE